MTSTSSSERLCECGDPVAALSILGVTLPFPYCAKCGADALAAEEQAEREKAERDALAAAGGTPRLVAYTLDSIDADLADAVATCRAWIAGYANGGRNNLWITGPVGTGKSTVAWAVIRELALGAVDHFYAVDEEYRGNYPSRPALFVCWRDLLADLRAQMGSREGGAASVYDRARRVPVLALDDLGAERPTEWALEALASLVQARYDGRLPTIITSNYRSNELAPRLGHEDETEGRRIVSRLVEDGISIHLDGRSRRRAA